MVFTCCILLLCSAMNMTFEDRRKENFEKGQAELERRRAMLREQQQKENEARLAAERAEQEKRERIRSVSPLKWLVRIGVRGVWVSN